MVTLRRIGVRSAARLGFWLAVTLGLIQVIIVVVLLLVFGLPIRELLTREFFIQLGLSLLLSGVSTAITVAIMSAMYNLVAGVFGGLKLDFEMPDTPTAKRKNGEPEEII